MKLLPLTIKISIFIVITACIFSCGEKIEGTFYLTDEARKYQIDTTIKVIKMVDNFGISEEFNLDKHNWYHVHHYFNEWGTDGEARGETYGVAYNSVLNRFMFLMVMRAGYNDCSLEIEWNQKDQLNYNFKTKQVYYEIKPELSFYDTLTVRGVKYNNIIKVNYTDVIDEIDDNTPVITYISGDKGLIKLVLKDNIILERLL